LALILRKLFCEDMKIHRAFVLPFQNWSLAEIPYSSISVEHVQSNTNLLYLLAAASFVEITSDLYTGNLIEYFQEDDEIKEWLESSWQAQELRHGQALRQYVRTAWPNFNWECCYSDFKKEYSRLCKTERLAATHALEMASRCFVETGTSTLYTMIHRSSPEPVLALLTAKISSDEIRHYKYFYHYFLQYRDQEHPGSRDLLRVLWNRIAKVNNEDAFCAFKYVFQECNPHRRFRNDDYKAFRKNWLKIARQYYPLGMAVKMFLTPVGLSRRLRQEIIPILIPALQYIFL
jgi:hypothetical protein